MKIIYTYLKKNIYNIFFYIFIFKLFNFNKLNLIKVVKIINNIEFNISFYKFIFFYKLLFNLFSLYLKFFLSYFNLKFNSFIIPIKVSTYTVLRSPHIDKRSREQFRLIIYKRKIFFPFFFSVNKFYILKKFFFFDFGISINIKSKFLNR
jgi:hypothetical protein